MCSGMPNLEINTLVFLTQNFLLEITIEITKTTRGNMGALMWEVVEEEDGYHDNHGDNDMMAIVHHTQILRLCIFLDKYHIWMWF